MSTRFRDQLKSRLAKYPNLNYRSDDQSITIDAPHPGGFEVTLLDDDGKWIVFLDSCHEHFSTLEDALDCCEFGFSERCRLEIWHRGNSPYWWTLMHKTDAGWKKESTTALFFFPFWRRKRVEYLSNHVKARLRAE